MCQRKLLVRGSGLVKEKNSKWVGLLPSFIVARVNLNIMSH